MGGCAYPAQKTVAANTQETWTARGVLLGHLWPLPKCSSRMWPPIQTLDWNLPIFWKHVGSALPLAATTSRTGPVRTGDSGAAATQFGGPAVAARRASQRMLRTKIYDRYSRLRFQISGKESPIWKMKNEKLKTKWLFI